MFILLTQKILSNSFVEISLKNHIKYSNKWFANSLSQLSLGFNSSNYSLISVDNQQIRRFYYNNNNYNYCEHKCESNKRKHKLLSVKPMNSSTNDRNLWGKAVKKPGEIAPGIKVKDVTLVSKLFKEIPDRHKQHFLAVVDDFPKHKYIKRQGYPEFITAALPFMKEFGVEKDLEAYKALMNVYPKGRFRPDNIWQAGSLYYPLQQKTAVQILCQMELNGVMPDKEMESLIIQIFSKYSSPWRKCARMTYWMTKFANANPFPLPDELPLDSLELAILALKRMCIDVQTKLSVFSTAQVEDSIDKTWIVSAQSPSQRELISELPENESIFVEGSFKVWLRHMSIGYFVLRANSHKKPLDESVENDQINDVSDIPLSTFGKTERSEALSPTKDIHVQEDGKILAICATGTSSRDSLLSWIRILQSTNPKLQTIPVVFTLRGPSTELQNIDQKDLNTNSSYDNNSENSSNDNK